LFQSINPSSKFFGGSQHFIRQHFDAPKTFAHSGNLTFDETHIRRKHGNMGFKPLYIRLKRIKFDFRRESAKLSCKPLFILRCHLTFEAEHPYC